MNPNWGRHHLRSNSNQEASALILAFNIIKKLRVKNNSCRIHMVEYYRLQKNARNSEGESKSKPQILKLKKQCENDTKTTQL